MTKKKKVLIVSPTPCYVQMFQRQGWEITDKIRNADLVQFTGGEDVSPVYYHEMVHPRTRCNPIRDKAEKLVFLHALKDKLPMAGICRGGQFLNVMCGGKMWQHVDGHALAGTHDVYDMQTGVAFKATSTHHQMMIPGEDALLIGVAKCSTKRERMKGVAVSTLYLKDPEDVEILYYPKQKVFCFQPHPEYMGYKLLADIYFDYLKCYLGV